jgi:hypothetical protein
MVSNKVEEMLAAAHSERRAGNSEAAERTYASAAEVAREEGYPMGLAHALRHVSDLARERGSITEAIAAASEAVTIYRAQENPHLLHLANALRLHALALEKADTDAEPHWREARALYQSVSVLAGVEEAQRHLDRQNR